MPAESGSIAVASRLVTESASSRAGWGDVDIGRLELALEEVLTNIIRHAYPSGGGDVRVELDLQDDGSLRLLVEDSGIPFDMTAVKAPDLASPLDDRVVGGLGIHLVKSISDSVTYQRYNEINRLDISFSRRDMGFENK